MVDTRSGGTPDPTPTMPRWVKGFVIVAALTALLVLAVLLLGGGPAGHGPARHLPDDNASRLQAPAGHAPPADVRTR